MNIEQWPEDFNFDITRAINAPATRRAHGQDSTAEGDEDEKKSGEAIGPPRVENDDSDNDLDPVGLQKAFRFAAWSSVVLVGPFSQPGVFCPMNNVNPDRSYDHPHSAPAILHLNCLQRGRIFRQVQQSLQLRYAELKLTRTFFFLVAWVVVAMIWTFCSAFTVVLYPLWESRAALTQIATGIVKVRCFPSSLFATAPLNPSLCFSFVCVLYDV